MEMEMRKAAVATMVLILGLFAHSTCAQTDGVIYSPDIPNANTQPTPTYPPPSPSPSPPPTVKQSPPVYPSPKSPPPTVKQSPPVYPSPKSPPPTVKQSPPVHPSPKSAPPPPPPAHTYPPPKSSPPPTNQPPKSSPPPPVPANHPPPPTMHPVDYLRCDGSAGNGCGGKTLACPYQCLSTRPRDPAAKACYIDCHKCETSCRKRKPDCEGIGAACYDPRFVGGDGVMFYFHGKCNEDFSLVSDNHLQINAHFIGKRPEGRSQDYTWVQSLGIMFGTHTFTVGANKVAKWDEKLDHLFFSFDNHPFTIPRGHLSVWDSPSGDLTVERTAQSNSVKVSIPKMLELSISVVPITEKDNLVHNYQIPSDDCFAHLEIQFKYLNLSRNVEGVLGQTYRPDFKNPVKVGVAMPIMGGEDKYRTSSLLSADCNLCKFWPNSSPAFERLLEESISGFDCSSKIGNAGHGIVCRK